MSNQNETLPVEKVDEKIRTILPPAKAADFIDLSHYIMAKIQGGCSERVEEVLNARFGGPDGVDEMVSIYNQLSQLTAVFSERKGRGVSISGERSLLVYLTDGSSHLKVYPSTTF